MSGICRKKHPDAEVGTYELVCECTDSDVALMGFHAINGEEEDRWLNSDLFNNSQTFDVAATERHQTIVMATFTKDQSKTEVRVKIRKAGADLLECRLKLDGDTRSFMSIITPKSTQ